MNIKDRGGRNNRANNNKKPYIIIGLTPQGLSMLRILSSAGFKVYAFTHTKNVVGYASRYGEKLVFDTIDELKKGIGEIAQSSENKINCIITSGELLSLILDKFVELYDICKVQSGPYELIKVLSNKTLMYNYAQTRGLKCAKHALLNNYKSNNLNFPVILKRNTEIPLFFKIKKIDSEDEMSVYMDKINPVDYTNILVQEYIVLKNFNDVSIQAYLHQGEMKCHFISFQERRLPTGVTSFLAEVDDKNIASMVKTKTDNFFKYSKYTGFCEIEFIYDYQADELYFIEINTRPCGLHSVLAKKFKNLAELYLQIDNPPVLENNSKQTTWINIARDIKARLQLKDFKNLSQLLTSTYDIWDSKDLKPFFYQFVMKRG